MCFGARFSRIRDKDGGAPIMCFDFGVPGDATQSILRVTSEAWEAEGPN